MIRRLLRFVFRGRASGGELAAYRPRPGEQWAILSPGWVSPEAARRYPPEFIDRINQGRRR